MGSTVACFFADDMIDKKDFWALTLGDTIWVSEWIIEGTI